MHIMFAVALVPLKLHCYFKKIYLPCKKYRSSKSTWPIFWNRDIVYVHYWSVTLDNASDFQTNGLYRTAR